MQILMVCLGNICRSPTAAAVLAEHARRAGVDIDVDSAGTTDWHAGKPADPRTIAHAHKRGIDLTPHRARQVTDEDFARFDRIYGMDNSNVTKLQRRADHAYHPKIALLLGDDEVPDPWAGGPEDFERVLDLCELAARRIVAELRGAAA